MPNGLDITKLIEERQKLRKALEAMDTVLRSLDVDVASLDEDSQGKIKLVTAIKTIASEIRDGITKDAVLDALRISYPNVKANPQSVAAALVKLTQGTSPFLFIDRRGAGNQPTIYTTQKTTTLILTDEEIRELFAPYRTEGSGGWQSLFKRLQGRSDRERGEVILRDKDLEDMRNYYFHYGGGGWQTTLKRVFGRHIPFAFLRFKRE